MRLLAMCSRRLAPLAAIAATLIAPVNAHADDGGWQAAASGTCRVFFARLEQDRLQLMQSAPTPIRGHISEKASIAFGIKYLKTAAHESLKTDDQLEAISVPAAYGEIYAAMLRADRRGGHLLLKEAAAMKRISTEAQGEDLDRAYQTRYTAVEAIFKAKATTLGLTDCLG